MTTLNLLYMFVGALGGFFIRLAAEHIIEQRALKQGCSWPTVKGYEQYKDIYENVGKKCVVTLNDDDTWDTLDGISCHIIDKKKLDEVMERGGKALF